MVIGQSLLDYLHLLVFDTGARWGNSPGPPLSLAVAAAAAAAGCASVDAAAAAVVVASEVVS